MSHTLASAHDAIHARALAAWPVDATKYLPLIYTAVPLTALQKSAIAGTSGVRLSWARLSILDNVRDQVTIGQQNNRKFENLGVLTVEIYTPDGEGLKAAHEILIPAMRNAFETDNSGSLWFRRARSEPVGPDRFWFHSQVKADFIWLEIR